MADSQSGSVGLQHETSPAATEISGDGASVDIIQVISLEPDELANFDVMSMCPN